MGIEGVENLSGTDEEPKAAPTTRPTDQEIEDRKQSELAAEREEHNRRTGGGQYAKDKQTTTSTPTEQVESD